MKIESKVTSITWIPSEAIPGMLKLPFEMGVGHYDEPPPERIDPRLRSVIWVVSASMLARSACVIWPTFSSSVIRPSRSATRRATG